MTEKAPILVHGATGFTGGLVCELLAARGVDYAVSGRSLDRLERLHGRLANHGTPPAQLCVIDIAREEAVRELVSGRKMVLACAGPFALVGEPILAACARLGVHYADTTGEQRFVADAARRHQAACEETGACIVPAMAYEIAPADWACHLASERVGGSPDTSTSSTRAFLPRARATAAPRAARRRASSACSPIASRSSGSTARS